MITPDIAKNIVEKINGVTPCFAERGTNKGKNHVEKTYRFAHSGRHIAIVREATEAGVTVYLNQTSVSGKRFPEERLPNAIVTERYPVGHIGITGDKGLAASAARLPSINPKYNASMRISVSTPDVFQRVLNWYFSINEKSAEGEFEDTERSGKEKEPLPAIIGTVSESDQEDLESDTASLTTSEREAVVKVRFGQGAFRSSLLDIAGDVCWMSGIEGKELLIASHIQPWAHCEKNPDAKGCTDNGLLLSSLWDAAFDCGLVTFDEEWRVILSPALSESAKKHLGLEEERFLPTVFRNFQRAQYLAYHRKEIFKR
jgi:hypothetical protein